MKVKFKDDSIEELTNYERYTRTYHCISYETIKLSNGRILTSKDKLLYNCKQCNIEVEVKFSYDMGKILLQLCPDCRCIDTNMKRYGESSPMKMKETQEKSKVTCMKNFGVEFPSQSKEIKLKMKESSLIKYNVDHPMKSFDVQNKRKESCMKIYGEEYAMRNIVVQSKHRQTCLKNLGVEYPLKSKNIRDKMRNDFRNNFFDELNLSDRLKGLVSPVFKREEFTVVRNKYLWTCNTCGLKFNAHLNNGTTPRCFSCFPRKYQSNSSILERELSEWVESLDIKIIRSDRSIIYPLELDIYIPSKNLAIEFNGTYWHSSTLKEKWYHQIKVELCYRQNVRLLHIYEWEWKTNKQSCLDKINYFMNNEEKILPRRPIARFILGKIESNREEFEIMVWD